MKPLADEMAVYAAYHNDATNRAVHYVFVPLIVWSTMGLLALPGTYLVAGVPVTLAMVAAFAALAFYLRLDFPYGVALVALFTMGLVSSNNIVHSAGALALPFFATTFVLSWAAQVVSHIFFEGRKPALLDDAKQVLVAPMFVVAEWSFSLGFRRQLQEEVHRKMLAHMPVIPEEELPGRPLQPAKRD